MQQVRSSLLGLGLVIWLIAAFLEIASLDSYSSTPGIPGTAAATWPQGSSVARTHTDFTLVMVVHPHCPCSRASIGELSYLMAHAGRKISASVIFVRAPGFDDDWTRTDLWRSAGLIPGVTRIIDGGGEAVRFGASTSGQTMLYDPRGRLVFSGGITSGRGHFGDNAGVTALRDLLDPSSKPSLERVGLPQSNKSSVARTAVFGCPLFARHVPLAGAQFRCTR